MDGVGAGLLGCVEDLVEHEVGLGGRLSTEGKCLVCELHELRVCIGLGVNGNAAVAASLAARMTRTAISPRFATSTFVMCALA